VSALTLEQIENLRDARYFRTSRQRLRTEDQALDFINQVGFCFLFHDQNTEIPTLIEAISGCRRAYVNDHFDADVGRAWDWKDTLPTRGAVYYGKQLRQKPTLIALRMLPAFYALSSNYGAMDDYLQEYRDGSLSQEAKAVYEVLLERGPQPTTHLRKYANLWGGGEIARRFERAITELQVGFKIVKSGISDVSRWGYAYVYDLFLRRFPDVPEAARGLSRRQAMQILVLQHLQNIVAAPEDKLKRLFRWEDWEWQPMMTDLRARNLICARAVTHETNEWLVLANLETEQTHI